MAAFIFAMITKKLVEGKEETGVVLQKFDDACDAMDFYESGGASGLVEGNEDEYKRALAACGTAESAVEPVASTSAPPESVDGPPVDGDSAEAQGAMDASPEAKLSSGGLPEDLSNWSGPEIVFHPNSPLSPPEAIDRKGLSELSPSDIAEIVERWRRNMPEPGEADPTHSGQKSRYPTAGADPVDLFRGQLTLTAVDLEVPSAVLPLRLVRTYRSGRPYFGPWGFGWDHNLNVYVRELNDGGVAVWRGDLHEDRYQWDGARFRPDPGVHERLERVEGLPQTYELSRPRGMRLRFQRPNGWTDAERIPLLTIRDRHSNAQELFYDTNGRVSRVQDESGRALIFEYGNCGLLEGLTDHTGKRRVRYEHHANIEHLLRVTTPSTATYPKGATTTYEYDFQADHPAMQHNILRSVDPDGYTYLQNEFGQQGTGWNFNRVVKQIYGDLIYECNYEQIQYVPPKPEFVQYPALRTEVRTPDGALHTHTFNYRGDLLEKRLRLNSDGSYRVVVQEWEYDNQGNITAEVRPDQGRTILTYDAANEDPCSRGNLLKAEVLPSAQFFATGRVVFEATYDQTRQLPVEIMGEAGASTRLFYDFDDGDPGATGRLRRIELPETELADGTVQNSIMQIETNSRGQITAVITGEGFRHERHYLQDGPTLGFLQRFVVDAGGLQETTEYSYDEFGFLSEKLAPGGIQTRYIRNHLGQLEELIFPAIDGMIASIRRWLRHDGQVLRVERPRGAYIDDVIIGDAICDEYAYDVVGSLMKVVHGANTASPRLWEFTRDHRGRAVEVRNPVGTRYVREFDERGLLLSQTVAPETADTVVTKFTHDRSGRLERIIKPNGAMIRFERDPWGRIAKAFYPNGSIQNAKWGPGDKLASLTVIGEPGDGQLPQLLMHRDFDFDARGRLRRDTAYSFSEDPNQSVPLVTSHFYDGDDRRRRVILPRGGTLHYEYDAADRLVKTIDVHGNTDRISYGTDGQIAGISQDQVDPEGVKTVDWGYIWDVRRRLRRIIAPTGAVIELDYDDRDLIVERREPLGVTVGLQEGLLGEITEHLLNPGGLGILSRQYYDLLGDLNRYQDPAGEVTSWEFDARRRPRLVRLPDLTEWHFTFDPAAAWMQRLSPSGTRVLSEYDASGRLVRLSTTVGPGVQAVATHEFQYDGLDRLVRATRGGETVRRRYDSVGRIIEEGCKGKTVRYKYDDLAGTVDLEYPDGRLERTTVDLAGRPISKALLQPGALAQPGGALAHLTYAGRDRLHSIVYGNGVRTDLRYDDYLRLAGISHLADGGVLASVQYRYDLRNRRRIIQYTGPGIITRIYYYDARDRLVRASSVVGALALGPAPTQQEQDEQLASVLAGPVPAAEWESYELDTADSRQQRTRFDGTASTTAYGYLPGHRLQTADSESFAYHLDGSRSEDSTLQYDIDALGRLVRFNDPGSGTVVAEFSYDALGRVASGQVGGIAFSAWFAGSQWIHKESAGGTVLRQRSLHPIWPIPLVETSDKGPIYLQPDAAMSIVCGTDASSSVVQRMRFQAFGELTVLSSDGTTEMAASEARWTPTFAGLAFHTDLGLYASGSRLYDPRIGAFLSRDPHLYASSPSTYIYANHNPVDNFDPAGLDAQTVGTGRIGHYEKPTLGGVLHFPSADEPVQDPGEQDLRQLVGRPIISEIVAEQNARAALLPQGPSDPSNALEKGLVNTLVTFVPKLVLTPLSIAGPESAEHIEADLDRLRPFPLAEEAPEVGAWELFWDLSLEALTMPVGGGANVASDITRSGGTGKRFWLINRKLVSATNVERAYGFTTETSWRGIERLAIDLDTRFPGADIYVATGGHALPGGQSFVTDFSLRNSRFLQQDVRTIAKLRNVNIGYILDLADPKAREFFIQAERMAFQPGQEKTFTIRAWCYSAWTPL